MQYSNNPSVFSENKLSIQKLGLSSAGMQIFELLYLEMQKYPEKYKFYFHFSMVKNKNIDLTKFKEGLYELLAKNIIYRSIEDFTYFVNVNLINIHINEDCLAILRYTSTKNLEIDFKEIVSDFSKEVSDFKFSLIKTDGAYKYTINDLEKLSSFFLQTNLQQLNMKYRYCTSLSGVYQGFTVDLVEEASHINYLIDFLKLNILNIDLNNIADDERKEINGTLNNYIEQLIKSNIYIDNNTDEKQLINYILTEIIDKFYKKLLLWVKAFSIQKTYKECYSDKEILFFSHRINGWSQPIVILNNKLSAEYKTNFGYGHSSYFYVKLKYDNIEIIPFCDLVRYEYVGVFEINQYSKKLELEDDSWKNALMYVSDAYNTLIDSEEQFINKYIVGEINSLIFELGSLMEKNHFKFIKEGEIEDKEFYGTDLIIFRAKKITSALDFVLKIKESKNIMEVDLAIKKIEGFNISIKFILENEIDILNNKLKEINNNIINIRPEYIELRDREIGYQKNKKTIKEENIFNSDFLKKIINVYNKKIVDLKPKILELKKSEHDYHKKKEIISKKIFSTENTEKDFKNIFLLEYPEYKDFYDEYQYTENEFSRLNESLENIKNILEYLNIEEKNYQKKIEEISKYYEIKEELDKIFLSEYPEYTAFSEKYKIIETRWLNLIDESDKTKNILEDFNIYHGKILEYFK